MVHLLLCFSSMRGLKCSEALIFLCTGELIRGDCADCRAAFGVPHRSTHELREESFVVTDVAPRFL